MRPDGDASCLVALLRSGRASMRVALEAIERDGGAEATLEAELGLLAAAARESAAAEIESWQRRGIGVLTPLDQDYPRNLLASGSPPPLLFIRGALTDADEQAVAVVGARRASPRGLGNAAAIARQLVADGFTVVSGLAAGIDGAAHVATLEAGGRTVAVVGCGLDHCYPSEHAALQRRIAERGAVISQFWPESPPSRRTFPMRNGVMARLTQATVIVEASETSGTRIQARLALADGRPVLLLASVLEQAWARELAARPGVTVIASRAELGEMLSACLRPAS